MLVKKVGRVSCFDIDCSNIIAFEKIMTAINHFTGLSPRLEPFYHGQVFNANKSTQVQVLPSSNLSDS